MSPPDLAGEASRAGFYALIGGALLKLAESLLRRADRKHRETLEDIDKSFATGAIIRDELRKENEALRHRRASMEVELMRLQALMRDMQTTLDLEKKRSDDALAELRVYRIRERERADLLKSPVPPSKPSSLTGKNPPEPKAEDEP